MYQTEERPESNYAESYLGGDDEDYDALKSGDDAGKIAATDGNLDGIYQLWTEINSGMNDNQDYFRIQGMNVDGSRNPAYTRLLDAENLIDFMIMVFYTADRDRPIGPPGGARQPRNLFMVYNRENPDGVQIIPHDAEHSLEIEEGVNANHVSLSLQSALSLQENCNPWSIHLELMADNAEYRMKFADHIHKYFFNNGLLTPNAATERLMARAAEIDLAVICESARWGDAKSPSTPRTRDDDWVPAVNKIVNNYMKASPKTRTDIVLSQFKSRGWYPNVDAPTYNQHGGEIAPGFALTINASAGTIYYTLDGSDPRTVEGTPNPDANTLASGSITVNSTTQVLARAYSGGTWSALTDATFVIGTSARNFLRITEVNYNPLPPSPEEHEIGEFNNDDFEFIELQNISDTESVSLVGVRFTDGITMDLSTGTITVLDPGARLLVVANQAAFTARYGERQEVTGSYSGNLNNAGEMIRLVDSEGQVIHNFTFDDESPWPETPDGEGPSLEVINVYGDYDNPANWKASRFQDGSPGNIADFVFGTGAVWVVY